MAVDVAAYQKLMQYCTENRVTLVAVSKTKPASDIEALYELGHRDFGENYVQELAAKAEALPRDIRWHFIGHLQRNKVKLIAPFVHLIHGVDSLRLLQEINNQASRCGRIINCLLQMHISGEATKFGMDEGELDLILQHDCLAGLSHVRICGLMGMASFTDNEQQIQSEFKFLKTIYTRYAGFSLPHTEMAVLSMGMSSDYRLAVALGSNMIRIGSMLFGQRNYTP